MRPKWGGEGALGTLVVSGSALQGLGLWSREAYLEKCEINFGGIAGADVKGGYGGTGPR